MTQRTKSKMKIKHKKEKKTKTVKELVTLIKYRILNKDIRKNNIMYYISPLLILRKLSSDTQYSPNMYDLLNYKHKYNLTLLILSFHHTVV